MSKLTLAEWAADHFRSPPSANTLRRWAREGLINPKPIKHGRNYYVEQNAHYLAQKREAKRTVGGSLIERIEADRARLGL